MNRRARAIADRDLRAILASLDDRSTGSRRDVSAMRVRVLALLGVESGLRLSEALALRLEQVIEDPHASSPRIVAQLDLEEHQAKGRSGPRGYTSAGIVNVPKRTRAAIRAYVIELRRRGWIKGPPWRGTLFVRTRPGRLGSDELAHGPWSARSAQAAWIEAQRRAGVARPYRVHDLRHTAITRWAAAAGGDAYAVAALARHADVRTSIGYVHHSPARMLEIAERAARP